MLTIDASGNDPTPGANDFNGSRIFNVDDRNKAMSLGADAFAHKPVERRWLLDHLQRFTGTVQALKVVLIDVFWRVYLGRKSGEGGIRTLGTL